jgi:diguanylate cyclase (GGDEF)-like protein
MTDKQIDELIISAATKANNDVKKAGDHLNDRKLLESDFGTQVLTAYEERELFERDSLTDRLTGVGSSRAQEKFLDADEKRQSTRTTREKRSTGPLYPIYGLILYLDADGLKEANNISHETGDELLKIVARSAQDTAQRANDLVFRQGADGADEFAIVLPGETEGMMEEVATKFFEALKKNSDGAVNASVAVGKYGYGKTARQTMKELDLALSEAKKKRAVRGAHVDTIYLKDNV